jgi:hypothetical protein
LKAAAMLAPGPRHQRLGQPALFGGPIAGLGGGARQPHETVQQDPCARYPIAFAGKAQAVIPDRSAWA